MVVSDSEKSIEELHITNLETLLSLNGLSIYVSTSYIYLVKLLINRPDIISKGLLEIAIIA